MPQVFDLILMNGVVVNQDGVGPRDIGVRDGKIADIGPLSAAPRPSGSTARGCISCRA